MPYSHRSALSYRVLGRALFHTRLPRLPMCIVHPAKPRVSLWTLLHSSDCHVCLAAALVIGSRHSHISQSPLTVSGYPWRCGSISWMVSGLIPENLLLGQCRIRQKHCLIERSQRGSGWIGLTPKWDSHRTIFLQTRGHSVSPAEGRVPGTPSNGAPAEPRLIRSTC